MHAVDGDVSDALALDWLALVCLALVLAAKAGSVGGSENGTAIFDGADHRTIRYSVAVLLFLALCSLPTIRPLAFIRLQTLATLCGWR
jgi:hypothetical protein